MPGCDLFPSFDGPLGSPSSGGACDVIDTRDRLITARGSFIQAVPRISGRQLTLIHKSLAPAGGNPRSRFPGRTPAISSRRIKPKPCFGFVTMTMSRTAGVFIVLAPHRLQTLAAQLEELLRRFKVGFRQVFCRRLTVAAVPVSRRFSGVMNKLARNYYQQLPVFSNHHIGLRFQTEKIQIYRKGRWEFDGLVGCCYVFVWGMDLVWFGFLQVLPGMIERRKGTILFTGSDASVRGSAGFSELTCGKFALRGLSQCLAREFQPQGIHVAHIIIDGTIGTPKSKEPQEDGVMDPDAIAQMYWQVHIQDRSAWTQELDLRPFSERF